MNSGQNGQVAYAHFLGVLYRHKQKSLATFVVICLATVAAILFMRRTYSSEAKLFVRIGRESVTLDPTATTGQTVTMQKSQESEVNSILEILNGREIAQQLVYELGADTILESDRPPSLLGKFTDSVMRAGGKLLDSFSSSYSESEEAAAAGIRIPTKKEELAVRHVLQKTSAWAPKLSTVVTIMARAGSPRLAQQIAQTKMDLFMQEHVRLNRTMGSFDFFAEQTELDAQQLRQAQQALYDKLSEFKFLTVGGKRETLQQKLRDIQLSMMTTDRQLALVKAKQRDLLETLAELPVEIVTERSTGHANEAHDMMRGALYDLEIREQELLQTYAPTHPYVESVQEQRRDLAEILESHPTSRTQQKTALNPTRQALELTLETQEVELEALTSTSELLEQQFADAQDELQQLNKQSVLIAALEQDVGIAEANYRAHADKLEQARIGAELQSDRISNVNVVQPATYVRKPVRPQKLLLLVGGFMCALVGALAVALVAESLDTSLRTVEQTEAHLGVPVLLSVPSESRFSSDKLTRGAR